ncbi:MAG: ABC transporter permease [Chitinophagales bacterium]|nr:ABC transporter permease [Chitinophagales bacterium]
MASYLYKRILYFIPTLVVISLLAFVISVNAPGDPVERLLTSAESGDIANRPTQAQAEDRIYWTHRLGLDLPVFYFSISPLSYPDTLFKIIDKGERNALKSLISESGNWKSIERYHQMLQKLYASHDELPIKSLMLIYDRNELREAINKSQFNTLSLLSSSRAPIIRLRINELASLYSDYPFFKTQQSLLNKTSVAYEQVLVSEQIWKNYLPRFQFYPKNQYHRWIFGDGNWLTGKGSTHSKGLIRGDLGMSYINKMPVNTVIADRIGWSLFFTLASVIIAYLISIPIGIRAATKHGSLFDRTTSVILFMLHSMPSFWVATLLLIFFANTDLLHLFPASGVKPVVGYPASAGFFSKAKLSLPYLILPIIAYTYGSLAFISRLTRVAMLEVLNLDYIRTARAKGLLESSVIYKHGFRNALLPLITIFANILPVAIGGSVILETIFSIPGMGLETYQAIQTQNYPMIVGVFTITGILTLTGYLIADLLYAAADPRISYLKN